MRTVTLEFLRHGPPNNQLLSPLTQYLALCGNRPAVTVNVGFEHADFLSRLRSLRYESGARTRKIQIDDVAAKLGDMLSSIRGLISELADTHKETQALTHVRLIISANEVALLPFELTNTPNGVAGEGLPFLLQTDQPICITREIRRVKNNGFRWPAHPKVLFAYASPAGVASVPFEAHLMALRQLIEPWCGYYKGDRGEIAQVTKHLDVLPDASVGQLAKRCATGAYTHVHILAHGVEYESGEDHRFGLALCAARGSSKRDDVSGDRLATALRSRANCGGDRLAHPAVVTVASCDGGNAGTVYGAGASIAHDLHQSGIPFVVASQFPLTVTGSVHMVQTLYEGLLKGNDPRLNLDCLRRKLKVVLPEAHDWASLVAYASFSDDFENQLRKVRLTRTRTKIEAALDLADGHMKEMPSRDRGDSIGELKSIGEWGPKLRVPFERLRGAIGELKELLDRGPDRSASLIYGLLASAEKREAEIRCMALMRLSWDEDHAEEEREYTDAVRACLKRSRDFYGRAFEHDRTQTWGLIQRLSLDYLLSGELDKEAWRAGRFLCREDIEPITNASNENAAWALGNRIELALLALIDPKLATTDSNYDPDSEATTQMDRLLQLSRAGQIDQQLYSHRKQFQRYVEMYPWLHKNQPRDYSSISTEARGLAKTMVSRLDP